MEEKLIEKVLWRRAELKWLKEKRAVVIVPDGEGDEAELIVSEAAFVLQIKLLNISALTKTDYPRFSYGGRRHMRGLRTDQRPAL